MLNCVLPGAAVPLLFSAENVCDVQCEAAALLVLVPPPFTAGLSNFPKRKK